MVNKTSMFMVEKIQLGLLLGILFFIPISPAVPNILGVLLMLSVLWQGDYASKWQQLKVQPVFWVLFAYLLIYPLSLLWSSNLEWGVHIVERHLIYLLFPFLLLIIKKQYLAWYFSAFIAGITLTEVTSYLVWFELIQIVGVDSNDPTPFYNHISYNPMLAWCLYLLMSGLFFTKQSLSVKLIVILFIITMTINMFITGGRGGQLTYFIITGLIFLQFFTIRGQLLRGVLFGVIFLSSIFTVAYQASDIFQKRFDSAVTEVVNYSPTANGSVSWRLHMYINTVKLAFDRPIAEAIFGSGIGDLPEDYTNYVGKDAPFKMVAKTGTGQHSHPHSQYFYELGALGLLGLFILISFFTVAVRRTFASKDEYSHHRWAFLVFMGTIMLTDSLLLAHPTGLLFIVFSALLYGHYQEEKHG